MLQSLDTLVMITSAIIPVLFAVIMGILVLLRGHSCIVNILHHHHDTYNHYGGIKPLDFISFIKYN